MTGNGLTVETTFLPYSPTMTLYLYNAIPYPHGVVTRTPPMLPKLDSNAMTFLLLSMSAAFYAMSDHMYPSQYSAENVGVLATLKSTASLLSAALCVALHTPATNAPPRLIIVATVVAHTVCSTAVARCINSKPK